MRFTIFILAAALFGLSELAFAASSDIQIGDWTLRQTSSFGGVSIVSAAARSNYVYATTDRGFAVIQLEDNTNSLLLNNLILATNNGQFQEIALVGDAALVAGTNGAFTLIDISEPERPVVRGSYKSGFASMYSLTLMGSKLYFKMSGTEDLMALDVQDPSSRSLRQVSPARCIAFLARQTACI